MYGRNLGPEGDDDCTPASGYGDSFVYRIDMGRVRIDRAYKVGAVPKVVATTPDDHYVLVTNWCSWDLSVISTRKGREVKRMSIGSYPRGIAVSQKGNTAWVAVMGGTELVRVDLRHWTTSRIPVGTGPRAAVLATGSAPRSLALAADGRALYVVNYESGTVTKLRTSDLKTLQTISACTY
jgi:YVTN family beta-propeller protein